MCKSKKDLSSKDKFNINMPKTNGDRKTELVATRLTPPLKQAVQKEAQREGRDVSEWLRNLLIEELRERDSLPDRLSLGNLEENR